MDLGGTKILITRLPQHAGSLVQKIIAANGMPICNPLFVVESLLEADDYPAINQQALAADLGIFISRNAIDIVLPNLERDRLNWRWATIGPGTATHLRSRGITEVVYAKESPANSKTMLEHLLATKINLDRQKIMIFTGANGDAWLARQLEAHGAVVNVVAAYKRVLPDLNQCELDVSLAVISCVTSLVSLHKAIERLDIPLVVVSERILQVALEMGYSTVYNSKDISDQNIIDALVKVTQQCKTKQAKKIEEQA